MEIIMCTLSTFEASLRLRLFPFNVSVKTVHYRQTTDQAARAR